MIQVKNNVISKKIQHNSFLLKSKSFAASFGVHAALFASVAMLMSTHPIPLPTSDEKITISLAEFAATSGDIHRMETASKPKESFQRVTPPAPALQHITTTPQKTPSLTPSVSSEASAPLAYSVPMPASAPQSASNDSPHQATSFTPVHELPKMPAAGNDISGAALGHIRAMIEKAIIYPTIARKLRLEGIVTVFFILNSDGTVDQLHISTTSGSKILDDKALNTILSLSGNFPALGKTVELRIPIAFKLS